MNVLEMISPVHDIGDGFEGVATSRLHEGLSVGGRGEDICEGVAEAARHAVHGAPEPRELDFGGGQALERLGYRC